MSSNATNTSNSSTSTASHILWSPVIFLLFVCAILIISIILILYFEKVCCFARYRFIKHFLRRLTRTPRTQTSGIAIPSIVNTPLNNPENQKANSSETPEYLYIAGQRESITTFEAISSIFQFQSTGTDLPDDDYTTIAPPVKQTNVTNRKLPIVPKIVENKENEPVLVKEKKSNDRRKTTITEVSRRRPTIEYDTFEHAHSAPSSPNLSYISRQRSNLNHINVDHVDNDAKSVSSDRGSVSVSGTSNDLSSGTLEVRLKFDAKNSKMWVFVVKATLEMNQRFVRPTFVQVHLAMLPNKRIRFRTRAKPADNAMFAEEFFCKVSSESIQTQGIRFRLYTNERFKREKLLAEASVMFGLVNLDEDMCKIIPLERAYPSDESDLASTRSSNYTLRRQNSTLQTGTSVGSQLPELEIGLSYDKTQSILVLEIGKGINFGMTSQGRAPDTYVQITLLNASGEEMVSNRTVTRRAQHHPVFAERYPFNIQENLLTQITLVITVINKKSTGKTDSNIGWISFGYGASGNVQVAHWDSMLNVHGDTITRWHALLES